MKTTTWLALTLTLLLVTASARSEPLRDGPKRKPEVWAVLVGIDAYNDPAVPRCHGAIRDAGTLARWLTETAHWDLRHILQMNEYGVEHHGRPEDNVRILSPTRENLGWAVTQWLGHRVQADDIVVIYFAGQAAVTGDRTVLLPIDARAKDLEHSGWSLEEALEELILPKRCEVVVWLDTSPSGRPSPVAGSGTAPEAGIRLLNRLCRWPGVTAWLAAEGRPATEGTPHGPFVSALANGLGNRPANLLACLDQMYQDPNLKVQGFRALGGIRPQLTLWPADLLPEHPFQPELLLQVGHADVVTNLAVSADGEWMITASQDSTVRIWRVRDREVVLIRVLPQHMVGVTALALSANGRFLASGDGAGEVRVWDLVDQRERRREGPSPHRQRISRIAFLPDRDGSPFVSLDQDGQSVIWDMTGPVLQARPLVPVEVVRLASASREGGTPLALAQADGKILLAGADEKRKWSALAGTGGRPTVLDLSPDGRRVAVGDEDGRVRVWDSEAGTVVFRHDYPERIGALRLDPAGGLAVGAGDRMYLTAPDGDGPGLVLADGNEVDSARFSDDGRWLAGLTVGGSLRLWTLADRAHPSLRTPFERGKSAGLACLTFTRDGQRLIAGEGDGGIRSWDLTDRRERPRIPPHRGKVDGLDVSADGRFLLEITHDGQALLWDLKEGRGARSLPGWWSSGAFLPNGSQLVMTRAASRGGDVVLVDRASGRPLTVFDRPPAASKGEVLRVDFVRVAVSRDGRKVAAATAPGQVEIACVWDVRGGPPRVLSGHTGSLTALDFSDDGGSLLTASEDGTANLWDLAPKAAAPNQPALVLRDPWELPITAARIVSSSPRRIVTADWGGGPFGQVVLWECPPGKPPRSRSLGEVPGRPHAMTVTPDGRWVGAAGQDRALHFWALEAGQAPVRIRFKPEHQHHEQVKALTAWAGVPLIASGGDDTTVRFWRLDSKTRQGTLVGTLVALPDQEGPLGRFAPLATDADWVAFTPEGVFDSSLDGDRQVRLIFDREVRPLEQYAARFHKFQLTDDLRRGISPEPPAHSPPPILFLDPPPVRDLPRRETELKVSSSDPSLDVEELRLYQNGVPVKQGRDFQPLGVKGRFAVRVQLRGGVNRFYAMASRRDDIDSRSEDVELRYDGPDTPARLHILAIGVKDYTRNALQFADHDARRIAEHLHQTRLDGLERPGEKIVLTDANVTEKAIEDAFMVIRRAVKERPEDTVVVFLAGHTDILRDRTGRERFSLLLPKFPFPQDAPMLASNRGVGLGSGLGPVLPPGVDLPAYVIYRNLVHLDALQRLIIIDACQAEAIYDDAGVRQIEELMERDTRKFKTSYLLAARRGESANESAILEHGLLTYVLLRGMMAPGLRPLPVRLPELDEVPGADADGDGIVTTRELHVYVDRCLPILTRRLPDLSRRLGPTDVTPHPTAPEALRLQASDAVFGLVALPESDGRRK